MPLSAAPVAPIAAHPLLVLLLQLGLLLAFALAFGQLARRFHLPAVVGELCAGVLLGPSLLANVAPDLFDWLVPSDPGQMHMIDSIGQVGVILLVGLTGLNVDLRMIRTNGATAVRVSAGGLLVPLGLGVGIGFLLPATLLAEGSERVVFAWFIGVAMCVSAIPVIAKTLIEMRLLHRDIGQLTISASAVDDIVGWLLLSVISALATTGVRAGNVARSLLYLAVVIVFALTVGRLLTRGAIRLASKSPEPGVTVATVVTLLFLASAGTHALGMEAVFGAFLAGILIGSSGWLDRERLAPLHTITMSVLAPLFFATVGLRIDLTGLFHPDVALSALAVLVIAIAGKFVGVYAGARASRLGKWESLALGAGMNARGVIEVVIAMVGLRLGVLTTEMFTIVVLVAISTSLMAPPMLRYAVRRMGGESEAEQARQRELAIV